ncbi:T9SS type A sorting domain-containing protein [candidate division KSB1 bacterium]|nr:T9SS type A sorting domain-containing protein [candidate division KSB1 bacterium]
MVIYFGERENVLRISGRFPICSQEFKYNFINVRRIKMKKRFALVTLLVVVFIFSTAKAGTLVASSTTGVIDLDGSTYLQGDATTGVGDLIQLIWVGPNGMPDIPDEKGGATIDDVIIDSVQVGFGFPFNPNEGKFSKTFTHDLLTTGSIVYMRAWNEPQVSSVDLPYGNSPLYQMLSDFDDHDFGTWHLVPRDIVPIELASFNASGIEGAIELNWITESETDNAGFNIHRSMQVNGERHRVNQQLIQGAVNSQVRNEYSWLDKDVKENIVYFYWLEDISTDGVSTLHGPVEANSFAAPATYTLNQNYPNPFNPTTTIQYSLKDQGTVRLQIFNIRGQMIRELVNEIQFTGEYSVVWDGRDAQGAPVPSGTYLYTLEINGYKETRKMVLMK